VQSRYRLRGARRVALFVLALVRCERYTLALAGAPASSGIHPGEPGQEATGPAGQGGRKTSRACQPSSEAEASRIKWSQAPLEALWSAPKG
jgi:hypothetical protein